jgi:glycosyltransferase involved in cell wall biosynthesis
MRILYVIPRYAQDLMGNRIHTEVMRCWQTQGVEVEVVCFAAGQKHTTTEVVEGIPVHRLPLNRSLVEKATNRLAGAMLHYPYFVGAYQQYRKFLATHPRFDFVHMETAYPLAAMSTFVPRDEHPPMAVTLPGADVMAEPAYDYGFARYGVVRRALKRVWQRADLVRGDSRRIQKLAIRRGCPPAKAVAIPYNITDGDFPPDDTPLDAFRAGCRAAIAARHGIAADAPLVLSLSRLHPFKGVEYLVQAAPETLKGAPRAEFLIAGPNRTTPRFGDYGAYLSRLADELGVADRVHLIGTVPHADVRSYMAAADAVVVPSVVEALNRVAIEAAAVGTPSVVTHSTGITDYILEHGCGLIVEPRSAQSIAAALGLVLTDAERARLMGAHGPAMAAAFRSRAIADALLAAYRMALSA